MTTTVVNNFDLYNTTNYWLGYSIPNYTTELNITQIYYGTQFSSNIIGSQIDFFNSLGGITVNNPVFGNVPVVLNDLPYLWKKFWWDELVYYSSPIVKGTAFSVASNYYQLFSESVGSLYFTSKTNNLLNEETIPYNPIIESLIPAKIITPVNNFYIIANNLFVTNVFNIGPGAGTDTSPDNEALIMADTDLERRLASNTNLSNKIDELYPDIKDFLPINTTVIGNLITPYFWSMSANNENAVIDVDFINTNTQTLKQLTISTLKAE